MSTPHFRISVLALAVCQAFAGAAMAQSAPQGDNTSATATLPEVLVTGSKINAADRASVAGFSDAALLDTPATVSVISRELMQELRIRTTTDASKLDASISDSYNAVGYAEQFSIRGFALDNNSSYRKDGLAISADTQIPLENKERIEILKGLAGFQSGVAAPGGIIDYITKRPTVTPLRSVTVEESERGTLYGSVDVGGRFEDTRFGYRVNAAVERLRSTIKGADGNRKFISGAFDWQLSSQALLQLDMDYQKKSQITAPGYQLLGGTRLPTGISADTLLNDQPWTKPVATTSSNIGLRFEYEFDANWHATLSANQHTFKRDDYTAFPYGCGAQNLYPGYCDNGDYDVYNYISLGEKKSPLAAQALLQGKFATGTLRHELTIGSSFFKREDKAGTYLYDYSGTSNIYHPVVVEPAPGTSTPAVVTRTENERAVFVQDILTLSQQVSVHTGLRYVKAKRNEEGVRSDNGFWLPNVALVYKLQDNLSLYGAYSQGLEHGGIAPIGTTNENTALAPARSKQVEVGAKFEVNRDLLLAASLFQIRKGLEFTDYVNTTDPLQGTYVRSGMAQNRGLELSAQGKASRALTLGASLMALNTRQEGTGVADMDGKRVTNVPTLRSSVFADYTLPQLPAMKVNGTWLYAGKKAFDPANTVYVPGYSVFNAGVSYATSMAGAHTTLRASVDNLFDKFYWRDVTQELGGYLLPGASRSFRVSAQFDF